MSKATSKGKGPGKTPPGRAKPRRSRGRRQPQGTRAAAAEILIRHDRDGAFPKILLGELFKQRRAWDARDRAFITELVLGTLRHRGRIDHALAQTCDKPLTELEPAARSILRVGAHQLLHMDRVPASAAVNESVNAAKVLRPQAASLINAVLRRLDRERGELDWPDPASNAPADLEVTASFPRWLSEKWLREMGEERTRRAIEVANSLPPLVLRANTHVSMRDGLIASLERHEFGANPGRWSPEAVVVELSEEGLERLPMGEGAFYIQDEGAQLLTHLVDPQPGERILEIGAAPGGKTTHLSALMRNEGRIHAIESHKGRIERLKRNAQILRCENIAFHQRDPLRGVEFIDAFRFDRILLDVPCSGLGILRRRPEIKWNRRPEEIAELARLQYQLAAAVRPLLKPGGRMVYATCTISREENEEVAERLEAEFGDLERIVPSNDGPFAATLNGAWAHFFDEDRCFRSWGREESDPAPDGFFAVVWQG